MKNVKSIIWIVAVLVIIGGSFFGDMKYGQTKKPSGMPGFGNAPAGQGQRLGNGKGGNIVSGEVISQDDKSITVKTQDGSTKVVYFSDSTKVTKSTSGSKSDLKSGAQVMASGTTNTDNSVTAMDIQIR